MFRDELEGTEVGFVDGNISKSNVKSFVIKNEIVHVISIVVCLCKGLHRKDLTFAHCKLLLSSLIELGSVKHLEHDCKSFFKCDRKNTKEIISCSQTCTI